MVKKVLVTGANGFIGKNLIQALKEKLIEVIKFDIENTLDELQDAINNCDFIFHLAGVNRPENDDEYLKGNSSFTTIVLNQISRTNRNIPLLLSSSIQAELDNPYGKSKKEAEDAVFSYMKEGNTGFIYRLHNVFGKWCRPNYNSAAATFCRQHNRSFL